MLYGIKVTDLRTGESVNYNTVEILQMLQQALPGRDEPAGAGSANLPYKPKTPAQWFFCAKEVAAHRGGNGATWLRTGDAIVRVSWSDGYACDMTAQWQKDWTLARDAVADMGPSYIEMEWHIKKRVKTRIDEVLFVAQARRALSGDWRRHDNPHIPVMLGAFFVSEVARNHTALHCGLMLFDLIAAVLIKDAEIYTLSNAFWHPSVLLAYEDMRSQKIEKADYEKVKDTVVGQDQMRDKPLSADSLGGLHPMAHSGSVKQSTKSLAGRPKDTLTIVRQKEATITIRWLEEALNFSSTRYLAEATTQPQPNDNIKLEKTGLEELAVKEQIDLSGNGYKSNAKAVGNNKLRSLTVLQGQAKTQIMRNVLLPLLQKRTDNFEQQII